MPYTHTAKIINTETMGTENIFYFAALLHKLLTHLWLKVIATLVLLPVFFFDPALKSGLIALACLIFIDFVSGVATAKKTGEQISSAKIFRTALKFAVYFTLISSGRLTVMAGLPFIPADAIILTFLACTELISIIENAGRCGYAVPQKLLNQLEDFRNSK